MSAIAVVGECRFCHCTAAEPCKTRTGDECGWVTKLQDRCTAERCIIAFEREKKQAKRALREELRGAVQPIREKFWAARRNGGGKRRRRKVTGRAA